MSTVPIWRATKVDFDDKLHIHNEVGFKAHLRTLKGELELIVRTRKKSASDPQYGYYFGVVLPLMCLELWGTEDRVSIEEMHIAMKIRFLTITRDGIQTVRSMSRAAGHHFDKAALDTVRNDPEVVEWLEEMTKMAFLPVKR